MPPCSVQLVSPEEVASEESGFSLERLELAAVVSLVAIFPEEMAQAELPPLTVAAHNVLMRFASFSPGLLHALQIISRNWPCAGKAAGNALQSTQKPRKRIGSGTVELHPQGV